MPSSISALTGLTSLSLLLDSATGPLPTEVWQPLLACSGSLFRGLGSFRRLILSFHRSVALGGSPLGRCPSEINRFRLPLARSGRRADSTNEAKFFAPKQLGLLTSLRSLWLRGGNVLPTTIGQLTALTLLRVESGTAGLFGGRCACQRGAPVEEAKSRSLLD